MPTTPATLSDAKFNRVCDRVSRDREYRAIQDELTSIRHSGNASQPHNVQRRAELQRLADERVQIIKNPAARFRVGWRREDGGYDPIIGEPGFSTRAGAWARLAASTIADPSKFGVYEIASAPAVLIGEAA